MDHASRTAASPPQEPHHQVGEGLGGALPAVEHVRAVEVESTSTRVGARAQPLSSVRNPRRRGRGGPDEELGPRCGAGHRDPCCRSSVVDPGERDQRGRVDPCPSGRRRRWPCRRCSSRRGRRAPRPALDELHRAEPSCQPCRSRWSRPSSHRGVPPRRRPRAGCRSARDSPRERGDVRTDTSRTRCSGGCPCGPGRSRPGRDRRADRAARPRPRRGTRQARAPAGPPRPAGGIGAGDGVLRAAGAGAPRGSFSPDPTRTRRGRPRSARRRWRWRESDQDVVPRV